MIIESLKKHFPARVPEWFSGAYMLAWGLYVASHPVMFTDPRIAPLFAGMASQTDWTGLLPHVIWGIIPVLVGFLRLNALFVNGFWSATPKIRLIASFCSAFVWTQVLVGLIKTGIPNTGIVIYTGLIAADIYSAFRATWDVVLASRARRVTVKAEQERYVERRGSSSNSLVAS